MGERLPGSMQAAARAAHNLGLTQDDTTQALFKAMEQGKLMAETFLPELSKELMKTANSGGALEAAMKSTGAAIGRFSTNVFLANKTFNEAGFDKSIRDLMNTLSTAINKAEPLWIALGKISEFIFFPLRAGVELFGSLASKIGLFGDAVEGNETKVKLLGLAVAALFRWSRKLLAVFLLIPAALSGVSKVIDGEQLTWAEWAVTLAGIAVSLPIILRALSGIKKLGGVATSLKGGAPKTVSETAQRAAQSVSRGSPAASEWMQRSPQTVWQKIGEGFKRGVARGARGGANFLPIGLGSVLSEDEFTQRQQDVPWWDLVGKIEQRQQEMTRQSIIQGDIVFNIEGDDPRQISDEVIRTINEVFIRPSSMNDPSTEK